MSNADFDQMFDLDMALTTSMTTTEEENSGSIKIAESVASEQNHRIELPIVSASSTGGLCTVCMEGFVKPSVDAGKQVPCGHIFHGTCIDKWLSLHNSCPLCRFNVVVSVSAQDH